VALFGDVALKKVIKLNEVIRFGDFIRDTRELSFSLCEYTPRKGQ
jgi:hypothetical protein